MVFRPYILQNFDALELSGFTFMTLASSEM